MNAPMIQLLVLAGIAVFLIIKLKSVLGTREGFEKPPAQSPQADSAQEKRQAFEVIEGGPDRDITDHVKEGSAVAKALAAMKDAEPSFAVGEFLQGARGAYEMILMAFERGDLESIKPFLSEEVFDTFADVVASREKQGLTIDAQFIGVREITLTKAKFLKTKSRGEVTVKFVGELTSVVRDKAGDIIEGKVNEIKRQKDVWTFARNMGTNDPNWKLVATGE
ncbi:MAG: preprotein translocase subunit Tim44 [Marinosulfonomonas sp.]|nr:MAG: preprotein translocase subunit Tim44 [Marinosulfonomonas sp.]